MNRFDTFSRRLSRRVDRQGQGYVEYLLDVVLVSLIVFTMGRVVSDWITSMYCAVVDQIARVIAKL